MRIVTCIPSRRLLYHIVLLILKATEVVKVERKLRLKLAGGEELVFEVFAARSLLGLFFCNVVRLAASLGITTLTH